MRRRKTFSGQDAGFPLRALLPRFWGRRCRRRMRGLRLRAKVDRRADHFFNHQRIPNQQFIRNAQNVDPALSKFTGTAIVVLVHARHRVVSSIQFDRDFQRRTVKVDDVTSDRNLTPKLHAGKAAIAQPTPHAAFRPRGFVAHGTSVRFHPRRDLSHIKTVPRRAKFFTPS